MKKKMMHDGEMVCCTKIVQVRRPSMMQKPHPSLPPLPPIPSTDKTDPEPLMRGRLETLESLKRFLSKVASQSIFNMSAGVYYEARLTEKKQASSGSSNKIKFYHSDQTKKDLRSYICSTTTKTKTRISMGKTMAVS